MRWPLCLSALDQLPRSHHSWYFLKAVQPFAVLRDQDRSQRSWLQTVAVLMCLSSQPEADTRVSLLAACLQLVLTLEQSPHDRRVCFCEPICTGSGAIKVSTVKEKQDLLPQILPVFWSRAVQQIPGDVELCGKLNWIKKKKKKSPLWLSHGHLNSKTFWTGPKHTAFVQQLTQ